MSGIQGGPVGGTRGRAERRPCSPSSREGPSHAAGVRPPGRLPDGRTAHPAAPRARSGAGRRTLLGGALSAGPPRPKRPPTRTARIGAGGARWRTGGGRSRPRASSRLARRFARARPRSAGGSGRRARRRGPPRPQPEGYLAPGRTPSAWILRRFAWAQPEAWSLRTNVVEKDAREGSAARCPDGAEDPRGAPLAVLPVLVRPVPPGIVAPRPQVVLGDKNKLSVPFPRVGTSDLTSRPAQNL